MYKKIIRPLLFELSPELIHRIVVVMLRVVHYVPGSAATAPDLFYGPASVARARGVRHRIPEPGRHRRRIDKDAEVYDELLSLGLSVLPEWMPLPPQGQPGDLRPRLFRLPLDEALINRMGFNNRGMENAVRNLRHRKRRQVIGASLGKNTATPNESAPADYLKLFRSLYQYVDYFVINVSCPNVRNLTHLQDKETLKEILRGLLDFRRGQNQYRPILLKISPDLTTAQLDDVTALMQEGGIDGIVATNTTTSREGLATDSRTLADIGNGGMSGAPLTRRSLETVRYIHEKTEGRFPIIGVGGIMTEDDAVAMLDAGADLIQVYTGSVSNGGFRQTHLQAAPLRGRQTVGRRATDRQRRRINKNRPHPDKPSNAFPAFRSAPPFRKARRQIVATIAERITHAVAAGGPKARTDDRRP